MGMNLEFLIPGVEYAEEADFGAETLGITSHFEQRFGTGALVKKVVFSSDALVSEKFSIPGWSCVKTGKLFSLTLSTGCEFSSEIRTTIARDFSDRRA
jgi:hypothetical protein